MDFFGYMSIVGVEATQIILNRVGVKAPARFFYLDRNYIANEQGTWRKRDKMWRIRTKQVPNPGEPDCPKCPKGRRSIDEYAFSKLSAGRIDAAECSAWQPSFTEPHEWLLSVEPGTRDTVRFVDDTGQLVADRDNGCGLSPIPDVDCFRKTDPAGNCSGKGNNDGSDEAMRVRNIDGQTPYYGQPGGPYPPFLRGRAAGMAGWKQWNLDWMKKSARFEVAHSVTHDDRICLLLPFMEIS